MNYNTLNTGSIVSYKGKLIRLTEVDHEEKTAEFWNSLDGFDGRGELLSIEFSSLQPVPITPELLEALGFEKTKYGENHQYLKRVNFPNGLIRFINDKLEYCEIYPLKTGGDKIITYKRIDLHELQFTLKLAPEIEFEITLEQLKDIKL